MEVSYHNMKYNATNSRIVYCFLLQKSVRNSPTKNIVGNFIYSSICIDTHIQGASMI